MGGLSTDQSTSTLDAQTMLRLYEQMAVIRAPSRVTTISSSSRAAAVPSAAGQYVSSAKTMPSSRVTGCSKEW